MTEFIDVSNNNGTVNWSQVAAAGIKGVYAKASEGTGFVDSHYATNRAGAAQHGLHFGAYHFARPDQSSAVAEADHFLATAQPKHGDLLPCLDFETSPMSVVWAAAFAQRVHDKLGVYPLLYASASAFPSLASSSTLRRCPIWVAAWSSTPPPTPSGWSEVTLWQYSGHGHVNGVSGECDRDKAFSIKTYGETGWKWEIHNEDGTTIATTEHPVRWALRHPHSFRNHSRISYIRKHL
jgi:lysozyme